MIPAVRARQRALTLFLSHSPAARWVSRVAATTVIITALLAVPAAALADPGGPVVLAAPYSLPQVIANLQAWLFGIFGSIATLVLAYAGLLRATAAGDTEQITRSKEAFKNALLGYGLAILGPVFLQVVKTIVGG